MSDLPVTATVNLPTVPDMTPSKLAKLAREIVMSIRELPTILADYQLTPEQFKTHIANLDFFKRASEAFAIEWNSALTTHHRLKLQAAAGLEEALPILGARMTKQDEALPAAVETGKLFAKIAGIGEGKDATHSGEKFSITINLGADTKLHYEKDITPSSSVEDSTKSLPKISEGA